MDGSLGRQQIIDRFSLAGTLGFCSGVVFAFLGEYEWGICAAGGAAVLFLLPALLVSRRTRLGWLLLFAFFLATTLGMLRGEHAKPDESRFAASIGEQVTVTGIISAEPSTKPSGQSFTLDADGVSMIVSSDSRGLLYGDEISVRGTLELPENFMTDQGTEFDYISYLYKDDILYKLKNAKVTVLSRGHGNWVVAQLIPVKNAVVESFHRVLPAPEANLLSGINLGQKSSIDNEFRNDLVTTGTIHIIALSGYNVTIVANFLHDLFVTVLGLSVRLAAASGALCIIMFVTMTGLQSSAVRSGLMAVIGIYARQAGRTYDAVRALVIAGVAMILWDPKYLVYDVSFQLSFLATLGLIFIAPIIERGCVRVPKKFFFVIPLREAMAVTMGAQLGVLPLILYKTGTLSIISLPANILVLPAIPLAMGLGALAGLIGSLSVVLAQPISLLTYGLLKYITGLITFFAKVPYAAVIFHNFPLWLAIAMYVILIWWVYGFWTRKDQSDHHT